MAAQGTPKGKSDDEALNAVCPYYTMFPLAVPKRLLSGASTEALVLDPFCGRGTTNYAARLCGLASVGVDSSPVAAAITEGKLVTTSPAAIMRAFDYIIEHSNWVRPPRGAFWKLCYDASTLQTLCRLRSALLENCRSPARKALRALVLGVLHGPRNKRIPSYLSNQMPRTYAAKPDYAVRFWTERNLRPAYVDVRELIARKAVYYFGAAPPNVGFAVVCGDSRTVDFTSFGGKFSHVVTSPPYYGMRTYVPDQWLRSWFLGGPPRVIYRHRDQMSHGSAAEFSQQLADVWTSVVRACSPGAKMVIRFGGIHDRTASPKSIMLDSLSAVGGLRLITTRSAGLSSSGKRQAKQFQRPLDRPLEEFDFHIRVEN